jgi:hypothetical protein
MYSQDFPPYQDKLNSVYRSKGLSDCLPLTLLTHATEYKSQTTGIELSVVIFL